MKRIFDAIKEFLLEDVNVLVRQEDELTLEEFDEKHIVFGLVDVSKFSGSKILVSVLPERQSLGEGNCSDTVLSNEVLVTLICGSDKFEALQKKVVLYAENFEKALFNRTGWGTGIEDVVFRSADFTFDAGSISGQLTAAEIRLTVNTEIETDDPFQ